MKSTFMNAQLMAKKHPKTFEAPTIGELNGIGIGSTVKVSIGNERFWVIVETVKGQRITAKVDNDLVFTDTHGLKLGDTISFFKRNVYSIWGN
jgi:hypothetical protein